MADTDFTPAICDELYGAAKYVAFDIKWKQTADGIFIFRAAVLTEDGRGLELIGRWVRKPASGGPRWGFDLKYHGNVVRSFDMAKSHKNPGHLGRITGPHKHRFSSSRIARLAYVPEISISATNANQALMDFLRECNIRLTTEYQDFMFT